MNSAAAGEYPRSSAHAGAATAFYSLIVACTEPRVPRQEDTQDSTFVHPSARKGRNGVIVVK